MDEDRTFKASIPIDDETRRLIEADPNAFKALLDEPLQKYFEAENEKIIDELLWGLPVIERDDVPPAIGIFGLREPVKVRIKRRRKRK